MRISYWSSDVCSSDLAGAGDRHVEVAGDRHHLRPVVAEVQEQHGVGALAATVLEGLGVEPGVDQVLHVAGVGAHEQVVGAVAAGGERDGSASSREIVCPYG